mgnify:CR=1 FL=1|tara:strand:- start:669 stop:848 length:180 start_codon:yes stop_codon:yes gene_type:complete
MNKTFKVNAMSTAYIQTEIQANSIEEAISKTVDEPNNSVTWKLIHWDEYIQDYEIEEVK